jgi:hypothetical protein
MHRLTGILAVSVAILLPCALHAQFDFDSSFAPPEELSPYLGQRVTYLESLSLSGIWEASNGHGGAVGIHLILNTTIPNDASAGDNLKGTSRVWRDLVVGVFERQGAEIRFGDMNYFTDSISGGSVTYNQGRLQLHSVATRPGTLPFDLDLIQQLDGCWEGRLHRGEFDSQVTLCRPATTKYPPWRTFPALTGKYHSSLGG